jgi:hypothetical protein
MFHLRTAQTLGFLGEVIRIELVWVGEVSLVMVDPVDGKAEHVILLQLQHQTVVSLACVKGYLLSKCFSWKTSSTEVRIALTKSPFQSLICAELDNFLAKFNEI